jgi:Macrocin-O-methyltransferase (TylF)
MNEISLKRRLISAASPIGVLDKPIQIMKWCRFVKTCECPLFNTRGDLYEHLENTMLRGAPMDYLEFGVANGASLIAWLNLHKDPNSRFWGFDSFEGLPEDWCNDRPKGTFARAGRPPDISHPRLKFVVGWFQETLPQFLLNFKPQARIIVHNDSDLYSATLFTLTQLDSIAPPGTIIIFDEFWDARHEFRALMDYALAYQRKFEVIAATKGFRQAAVLLGKLEHRGRAVPT